MKEKKCNKVLPTFIGHKAGNNITTAKNCVFIGNNAGSEVTEGDGLVIIGDDIPSFNKDQTGVMFIGDKIAIGKKLFGAKLNLSAIIESVISSEFIKYGKRTTYKSHDSFKITGRGKVFLVKCDLDDASELFEQTVNIDGENYYVNGVEKQVHRGSDKGRLIGLCVREK